MPSSLEILAADLARLPDETPMRIVAVGGGDARATHLCNDCRALKAIRARERACTILAERPEGTLEILRFGPGAVLALWTRRILSRRKQRTVPEALLLPPTPLAPRHRRLHARLGPGVHDLDAARAETAHERLALAETRRLAGHVRATVAVQGDRLLSFVRRGGPIDAEILVAGVLPAADAPRRRARPLQDGDPR